MPDEREYCCPEFAQAFMQRQICPSMDEDSRWNVRTDAFTYALEGIHYCPYCGSELPNEDSWEGV
jgi:hypothetical protein